jgi:hypothetical protein
MAMFTSNKSDDDANLIVEPLARSQRRSLLLLLVGVFVVAVPVFVFHAIGYRYDFFDPARSIVSTGALYVSVPDATAQIYVNGQPVRDARVFRRASYIQHLTPGMHRIHVSAPGLHTWVKELPVYPHIVTEAEAFLLPEQPQLRVVTEYVDAMSDMPLVSASQFEFLTTAASTTMPLDILVSTTSVVSTAVATSSVGVQVPKSNPEHLVLEELFETLSSERLSLVDRAIDTARQAFLFQTTLTATTGPATSSTSTMTVATSTKVRSQFILFEREDDVFVSYVGNNRDIPYYFCVPQAIIASTTEIYGAHVMQGVIAVMAATGEDFTTETDNRNRICRREILIDRQDAEVYSFDFINVGSEAVIMHRVDGVFVTEIDDRSWQNTQRIYGPTAEAIVVENNRIYIKDSQGFYAELLLTLIAANN